MSDINIPINCPVDKVCPAFANHYSITGNSLGEFVISFMYKHEDNKQATVIQKVALSPAGIKSIYDLINQVVTNMGDAGGSTGNRFKG